MAHEANEDFEAQMKATMGFSSFTANTTRQKPASGKRIASTSSLTASTASSPPSGPNNGNVSAARHQAPPYHSAQAASRAGKSHKKQKTKHQILQPKDVRDAVAGDDNGVSGNGGGYEIEGEGEQQTGVEPRRQMLIQRFRDPVSFNGTRSMGTWSEDDVRAMLNQRSPRDIDKPLSAIAGRPNDDSIHTDTGAEESMEGIVRGSIEGRVPSFDSRTLQPHPSLPSKPAFSYDLSKTSLVPASVLHRPTNPPAPTFVPESTSSSKDTNEPPLSAALETANDHVDAMDEATNASMSLSDESKRTNNSNKKGTPKLRLTKRELDAYRRGVKNDDGTITYFQMSFLEDPWAGFQEMET